MSDALDLAAAAERLGVHYQTAYKWVREGRLPAVRVRGRYRVEPADVDALIRTRDAPVPAASSGGRRSWSRLADRFFVALRDGDERVATDLVTRLHAQREPVLEIIDRVVVPAMARVGDDWSTGDLSVAEEHRATEIVERILATIDQRRPGRPRGTVVIAAPAGEQHGLPVAMASAALREDGWSVEVLGRDLPTDALVEFVALVVPDLVVLTVTTSAAMGAADDACRSLTGSGHDVLVGEPGASLADLLRAARHLRSEQRRLLSARSSPEDEAQ
jgi:MerR family transcriptional regulator, light-induced transcriptional regulator